MNFKILKEKDFGTGKYWLLAELNLLEYVESLVDDNFNFEVQRKIVKNRYLDGLLDTIELGEPLPNITLAYHSPLRNIKESSFLKLSDNKLDILDGLQRTYRLWAFWKIYTTVKEENYKNLKTAILGIKSIYPQFFDNGIVDSKFFKSNFPNGNTDINFQEKYSNYTLYFTIWSNLSEEELVKKMLVLNAGHKAVSTQHQFEILFLNLWKSLSKDLENIRVVREKEQDFNSIKRGERKAGEYLFSSIITSLMSLVLAKPQRISSDIIYRYDLINEKDEGSSLQYAELIFNSKFIIRLLEKLYAIDQVMYEMNGKDGVSWFGKDTTLNGVFAGVGVYLNVNSDIEISDLENRILKSFEELKSTLPNALNLTKFNSEYDSLTGRSVNIGNLIRTVVMNYTIHKLRQESTNWTSLFNQVMKKVMSIDQCAKDFLKNLASELEIFDSDLELSYETDILSVFVNNVRTKAPVTNVVTSITNSVEALSLDSTINLDDSISTYVSLKSVEISYLSRKKETKYRIRNFALASTIGAIIPVKYIENSSLYNLPQSEKDAIERKFREIILYYGRNSITQEEFSNFFKKVLAGSKNTVIAAYNSDNTDFIRLYSKSYFLYLLKGQKTLFPTDVIHEYKVEPSLTSSVNSSNNDFTQFFEVYDVIDEYHHANDILIKYLKLYQVIEYLITRTLLVKIQSNSSNQNLFLREMTSLDKFKDFDKSNFKIVFKSNETDLANWFKGKLSSNSTLKATVEDILYPNESKTIDTNNNNASYNALLTLIYKLRNTIVHNKESEIHLTIHNIKLRPELLKLLKALMLKLEQILFKKVVDFEEVITYKSRNLALY